eukprot:NODE_344_length_1602_cov_164.405023_g259_i0.p1 GENE.NODE_344_length_1602_cov_164.405023_g259_i0~~NODE_344_length_1602_cov_164.405023_g259_i0.p1  ORF type:complete len:452 (+),score=159.34 NODE_344_length_1602_cov_164.405023_g259_i0:34-1389(+)
MGLINQLYHDRKFIPKLMHQLDHISALVTTGSPVGDAECGQFRLLILLADELMTFASSSLSVDLREFVSKFDQEGLYGCLRSALAVPHLRASCITLLHNLAKGDHVSLLRRFLEVEGQTAGAHGSPLLRRIVECLDLEEEEPVKLVVRDILGNLVGPDCGRGLRPPREVVATFYEAVLRLQPVRNPSFRTDDDNSHRTIECVLWLVSYLIGFHMGERDLMMPALSRLVPSLNRCLAIGMPKFLTIAVVRFLKGISGLPEMLEEVKSAGVLHRLVGNLPVRGNPSSYLVSDFLQLIWTWTRTRNDDMAATLLQEYTNAHAECLDGTGLVLKAVCNPIVHRVPAGQGANQAIMDVEEHVMAKAILINQVISCGMILRWLHALPVPFPDTTAPRSPPHAKAVDLIVHLAERVGSPVLCEYLRSVLLEVSPLCTTPASVAHPAYLAVCHGMQDTS